MMRLAGRKKGIVGRRGAGFTIIELMLVVGLIGIIATIAIPTMLRFQLRAKVAEGRTNLAGIYKAEESYYAEYGMYVSAAPVPTTAAGTQKRPWGLNPSDPHGFNTIGFAPEGRVYFQYAAASNGGSAITLAARSDVDGDGIYNTWGYVKPEKGTGVGVPGPFGTCLQSGVIDPASGATNRLNLLGPCESGSGTNEF